MAAGSPLAKREDGMKNTKRTIRTFLILVIFAIFTSAVSVSAASASGINRKTAQITAGKTVQLSVKDKGKVTWSTSRKAVATVTTKGKVTGKKAGTATITAKVGKKKYTCKVTVKKAASSKSSSLKNGTLKIDSNTTGMTAEEAKVYKTVVAMKSKYPEGRRWTNGDYYAWNGGIFRGGYGCAGLTFLFSDAAFGERTAKMHYNFNDIKVGDIVRLDNNAHSVMVLKVVGSAVAVVEGNYNSSIHWGRVIQLSEIRNTGTYVLTRY